MNLNHLPPGFALCQDHVFKAVFTKNTPQSRGALTSLLSAFLGRKLTLVSVTANEPAIDDRRQRLIRYDINVRLEDGELANVEVMMNPKPLDPVRMEYYLSRLFAGQDIGGGGKSFTDLKHAWQVSIADQGNFFRDNEWFHRFCYYDPERRVSLGGLTSVLTLELNKLGGIMEKSAGEMSGLERWSVFIKHYADRSKQGLLDEIKRVEEGIAMAAQVAGEFTQSEIEYFQKISQHKMETAYWDEIAYAREEGEARIRQQILELLAQGVSAEELQRRLTEAGA